MNGEERKHLKRVEESKRRWRERAVYRSKENHFLKEKLRDIEESRSLWRSRAELAEIELKKRTILIQS